MRSTQLALDLALASRLESELDEELDCGREVVDHDADVFHPLDRHVLDCSDTTAPAIVAPLAWVDGTSQAQTAEASTQWLPPLQATEADRKREGGTSPGSARLDHA